MGRRCAARAAHLCLGQVATTGKGHELAAIPDVLALLDLSGGALVSLDALGCQPAIAGHIVAQGGYYLLVFKQNQRGLRAEAERALHNLAPQHAAHGWASHNTPASWLLDVVFREDEARRRDRVATRSFAVLRKLAFNLLQQGKYQPGSLRARRRNAGWNDNYMTQLLIHARQNDRATASEV